MSSARPTTMPTIRATTTSEEAAPWVSSADSASAASLTGARTSPRPSPMTKSTGRRARSRAVRAVGSPARNSDPRRRCRARPRPRHRGPGAAAASPPRALRPGRRRGSGRGRGRPRSRRSWLPCAPAAGRPSTTTATRTTPVSSETTSARTNRPCTSPRGRERRGRPAVVEEVGADEERGDRQQLRTRAGPPPRAPPGGGEGEDEAAERTPDEEGPEQVDPPRRGPAPAQQRGSARRRRGRARAPRRG